MYQKEIKYGKKAVNSCKPAVDKLKKRKVLLN